MQQLQYVAVEDDARFVRIIAVETHADLNATGRAYQP